MRGGGVKEDALAALAAEGKTAQTLIDEWQAEAKQWRKNNPAKTFLNGFKMYEYPDKVVGNFTFKLSAFRSIVLLARPSSSKNNSDWEIIFALHE